jgi:hypothetical protein
VTTFEVIEAKRRHCGQMARHLRSEQAEATARLGVDTHRRLVEVFEASSWRKAWIVDGALCGLGGLEGPILATEGVIWLALTSEACRYPVAMLKTARRQLQELRQTKHLIKTTILEYDSASWRFALHLGFKICGEAVKQNGLRLIPVSLGET